MRDNDRQLGKPMREYRDTRANIEALGLGAADEGCIAFATDLNKFGRFGGSKWGWDVTFNVKTFGAVGDNVVNDRGAIQAAMDAAMNDGGGIVYFPPLGGGANDRYKITAKLDLRKGVSLLGAHALYSRISAHASDVAAYPVLTWQAAEADAQAFFIKNLAMGFEDYYENVDAKVLRWTGAPAPTMYIIENVWLRNGYYGFYDDTDGFMGLFRRVWAYRNRIGYWKDDGGLTMDTCYAQGTNGVLPGQADWDIRGFDFSSGGGNWVMMACSMDSYKSDTDPIALFEDMSTFQIFGLSLEGNTANVAGNSVVWFNNLGRFTGVGIITATSTVTTPNNDDVALIKILDSSKAFLSGCRIGSGDSCVSGGGADTGYSLRIIDSKVSIVASDIPDMVNVGGVATLYGIGMPAAGACELTLDRVDYSSIYNPNNHKVLVIDEISVGTANSGGAGFRLLRVPNAPDTRSGALP